VHELSSILIESAKILVRDSLTSAHILIEDGLIRKVSKLRPPEGFDLRIPAKGLIALPGMIDAHVHLRDLELSYKETFETGTQAAAAGGFTTVIDMPNTRPPTVSSERLKQKLAKAQGRLFSNVAFQAALVDDPNEVAQMSKLGAVAFKLYLNKALETFDSSDEARLSSSLLAVSASDTLMTVHAEDGVMIRREQEDCEAKGKRSMKDFLRVHSPEAEVSAVRSILSLARKFRARVHVCHITTPEAVKLVRNAEFATCEAAAHHLLLNQSIFKKQDSLAVCVPPIRGERERRGLWRLFTAGKVDILASDHAPHTLEEKLKDNIWSVASGVPGLETSLPILFTQAVRGAITLRRLIEAAAVLPARIFRLPRKGIISEGFDADIVLVDPKAKIRIDPKQFLSKARYSPFNGMHCTGSAAYTIVGGTLVAERGKIVGPPVGQIVKGGGT